MTKIRHIQSYFHIYYYYITQTRTTINKNKNNNQLKCQRDDNLIPFRSFHHRLSTRQPSAECSSGARP